MTPTTERCGGSGCLYLVIGPKAGLLGAEEREQLRLLAVVRAGGIPERRPDAAEPLGDEVFGREPRALLVPGTARDLVEVLRERLREAVRERLGHDRLVVVVLGFEAGGELVGADPGGDRERTEVVAFGSEVIGKAAVRPRVAVVGLLAEEAEPCVGGDDVVAAGRSRPETEDAAGAQELLVDDPVEQPLRVVIELRRRRLVEDLRKLALQLPAVEA